MDDDALAELDAAVIDLLMLYEAAGVQAILIRKVDKLVEVRCQEVGDVVPLCKLVIDEHSAPADRTLN